MTESKGLIIKSRAKTEPSDIGIDISAFFKKFGFKLNDKRKEFFYMEMYSMLEAGMDLKKALDILINQQKKNEGKKFYEDIRKQLINGSAFWETMRDSRAFTPYEYYCVQIGEESGKLMMVLKEMSIFFSNKLKLKKQLAKSISYPIVIILSSVLAVGFMMTFIVPLFTDMFIRFDGDLPKLTLFFIETSSLIKHYGAWVFVVFGPMVLLFRKFYKRDYVYQRVQKLYTFIPYLGGLIKGIYYARFCSSMSLLLGAKVPLLDSLGLVRKMIGYYPLDQAMLRVERDIIKGSTLHDSFRLHKIFDEKNLAIICVGEEVNRLDLFFDKLHHRYMDEVEVKTHALNTYLEPLIILVLGGVIGLILVAMYLPMFKLSTSMGL